MARAPRQPGPIRRCEKCKEFGGLPGIAKQLQERYASVDWPQQGRTLETQLGKLDSGDAVWWRKRPEHAECLAQLLDLELLDLGLVGPRAAAHVIEFPAFPGMPPLDLRRDGKWQLGSEKPVLAAEKSSSSSSLEEWFAPSPGWHRPPYELNWLCVADDLDRHLLAKTLEAAGHYELVFAPTLEDVSGRLASTKPLVVVVSGPGANADADFTSLALRPEGVGLLVMAPYVLPTGSTTGGHGDMSWERRSLQGRERIAFDLSASGGGWSKVERWMWQRFPDWRARFLQWLERHFDKAGRTRSIRRLACKPGWIGLIPRRNGFTQCPTCSPFVWVLRARKSSQASMTRMRAANWWLHCSAVSLRSLALNSQSFVWQGGAVAMLPGMARCLWMNGPRWHRARRSC